MKQRRTSQRLADLAKADVLRRALAREIKRELEAYREDRNNQALLAWRAAHPGKRARAKRRARGSKDSRQ